jgi:hypothetical protein
MVEACSVNGGEEEYVLVIGGKFRRKETVRKLRHKWVNRIKMELIMIKKKG